MAAASKKTGRKGPSEAFLAQAGKGRPKGVRNKATVLAKDAIQEAFDRLGGVDRLVEWVGQDDDNRRVFYSQIWPKVLPLQVTGGDGGPVQHEVIRRIVDDRQAS